MIDADIHTQTERYGGATLEWTNRVDSAGSRIEWRLCTDSRGWVSRYGPVHNDGVSFGSRSISSANEEKELLNQLRDRVRALAGIAGDEAPGNARAA